MEGKKVVGIVTTTDLLDLVGRGAERPVATSERWVLKDRGPRKRAAAKAAGKRAGKRAASPRAS